MIRREQLKINLDEYTRLETAHKGESDRGIVLISATVLDDILRRSIESHLVDHRDVKRITNGFNAPLGTFSARILCAFAIGVIPEDEYIELELIRQIRNEFAHSVEVSFQTPSVLARCDRLLTGHPDLKRLSDSPRKTFIMSSLFLTMIIESRLPEVLEQRLFFQEWTQEGGTKGGE